MIFDKAITAVTFERLDNHRWNSLANPVFGDRCTDPAEQTFSFAFSLAIESMDKPESQPSCCFDLDGQVRDYIRHQWLIDQRFLEGASPGDVMGGLRERMAHQAG